jgi:ESX secretion system ATPase EccB
MQSRRDQVQAYFFVVGRLVAAVTHGRPDSLEAPNGRLNKGTVLGIVIGAVIAGIFGIIGIFVPGGDSSWRHEGAIVMNEDNGARYVFLQGQLRPVLNYSSARLVVGGSGNGQVFSVSQKSIGDTPIGQPIGIPDAPDSLPAADKLHTGPWTVCGQPAGAAPTLSLLLGEPAGARLSTAQALLVSTPDRAVHLVWQGKRHRVPDRVAQEALGYGDTQPVPVSAGWLNPVPPGRDLSVPATKGVGRPGPAIEGRAGTVGQVYEVRNPAINSDQFYLLREDGVTPLSKTTASLLLAHPSTQDAYDGSVAPVVVGPAALAGVPVSAGADLTEGLPQEPPDVVTPPRESVPCLRFGPSATGEVHAVAELLPATAVANAAVPVVSDTTGRTADRVAVPAGGGVLVKELPAPGANPGTTYLVTETGTRYPLGSADVVTALGYDESTAMNVPGQLLGLLPVGPLLSTQEALKTHASAS